MPEQRRYPNGAPCWADITLSNVEAAKEFYSALFGWTYQSAGPEYGGYTTCFKNGQSVAAISPPPPGQPEQPPMWTIYLTSEDVAATATTINSIGGKMVVEPMKVPDMGSMLLAADPSGATFGVWQPGPYRGAELYGEAGALCWVELNTSDGAGTDAFYSRLFDYEQEQVGGGSGAMDYTVWSLDGEQVCGRMQSGEAMPGYWTPYFAVDDVDATVRQLRSSGGEVMTEPMDSPYGRMCSVTDPFGARFSLITLPA